MGFHFFKWNSWIFCFHPHSETLLSKCWVSLEMQSENAGMNKRKLKQKQRRIIYFSSLNEEKNSTQGELGEAVGLGPWAAWSAIQSHHTTHQRQWLPTSRVWLWLQWAEMQLLGCISNAFRAARIWKRPQLWAHQEGRPALPMHCTLYLCFWHWQVNS